MKLNSPLRRALAVMGAGVLITAIGMTQIKEIIKVVGVGAAVQKFAPEINKAINKLSGHKNSNTLYTKVVPILTVGINTEGAIGAAQVTGPKSRVDQVQAVAAPEAQIFGNEIRIRALIPVSSKNTSSIKKVDGVGVSGIVDLKL